MADEFTKKSVTAGNHYHSSGKERKNENGVKQPISTMILRLLEYHFCTLGVAAAFQEAGEPVLLVM